MTSVTRQAVEETQADHDARLARGRELERAGEEEAAERLFREVLDATRGSGTRIAWVALANLTGMFMRQGRESECVILTTRLVHGAAPFEPFRAAWARQARCMALSNIEDWGRLAEELPLFEAAVPGSPEPHLTIFSRSVRALRATVALQTGSLEEARAVHAELAASLDETAAPNTHRFVHLMGAEVEQRSGNLPAALDAARRARAHDLSPVESLAGAVVEAECLVELEGPAAARRVVCDVLDGVAAVSAPLPSAALLLKAGPRLARLAEERLADHPLARRTYDLSGVAVLQRAVELDRDLVDLPELAHPDPADEASLAAFRARYSREKGRFLEAVARMLDFDAGAAFLRSGDETLIRVCAWCLRLQSRGGEWSPLGHLLAGAGADRVTHGICRPCGVAVRGPRSVRIA